MKYVIDATALIRKGQAHDYLAEVFDFPEYYGRNLDALYDCLGEMKEVEIEIVNSELAFGYYEKVLRVFKGAATEVTIK